MKNINLKSHSFSIILISCAIIPFLLAGCQSVEPVNISSPEPQATVMEQETNQVQELSVPSEPTISLDMGTIANDIQGEIIPAVSPDSNNPYWEILPQHQMFTFEGYEISEHMLKAQIFIYPVAELDSYNAGATQAAEDLKKLLVDKEVGENLPFLPLFNAAQVMHAKVEFLDFDNGRGVRYLTQFDQAPIPINNFELFYTYQGLSEDGKYYIAAIFPVTHPELPVNNDVAGDQEFIVENFVAELAKSVDKLEGLANTSFSPDLTKLDALIQSIEIK